MIMEPRCDDIHTMIDIQTSILKSSKQGKACKELTVARVEMCSLSKVKRTVGLSMGVYY